jgi:iron complex transport system ATP-binding protein
MNAPVLEASGISVRRGGSLLLSEVGLTCSVGEVVGLIGPNGAGKSTLLRVLAGVARPDTGAVRAADLSVARARPRQLARVLALVEQAPRFDFGFTVRDLVLMGRHAYVGRFGIEGPADLAIAHRALATVGMTAYADRDVTTLSGGERQLVAIARGLAQQPRVLLLDEPTSALDLGHQLTVLELARRVAADDVGIVVAMHDLDLAARMCDRLVLLVDGRVIATGRPDAVLTAPLLRQAYAVDAVVDPDPRTGAPTVAALTRVHTDPTPAADTNRPLSDQHRHSEDLHENPTPFVPTPARTTRRLRRAPAGRMRWHQRSGGRRLDAEHGNDTEPRLPAHDPDRPR